MSISRVSDPAAERRMLIFLLVLAVASTVAFQGWRTLFNNFAVEVGGLDGVHMGIVQSVREVPGFLSLLAIYVLLVLREHRLAAVSVAVLGLGVALAGLAPSFWGLTCTTLLMSFGFHYYETMNQSLTLQYFDHARSAVVMGRVRGAMAVTNIVVGGVVFLLARWLDYPVMFALLGAAAVAAAVWALTRDPSRKDLPAQRRSMRLNRRYWLFYALTFLSGSRRQIFTAFAVFLMVKKFGYTVQGVTVLFVLNNIINSLVAPAFGWAVNRFGERKMLSVEYCMLVLIFVGYAMTDSAVFAGVLYVLDNLAYNFLMAVRTFFQKIADPEDISSGMAVGFTINHIAAVVIPALGGLIWMVDYRAVFLGAAGLAVVSFGLAQCVDGQLRLAQRRREAAENRG